jgi:hypothetical protein
MPIFPAKAGDAAQEHRKSVSVFLWSASFPPAAPLAGQFLHAAEAR